MLNNSKIMSNFATTILNNKSMKANKLTLVMAILAIMFIAPAKAKAQVNAQLFYDFGSDREFVTLTLEMFKQDKWGNTYFFIDHDFNYDQHVAGPNLAPGGTYFEIARCLNFWQNSAIKNLSLHVEYNGGITASYPINNAWLVGVDYFMHTKDFKNTLNLKALYKNIKEKDSNVPMQFTAIWAMNDLFGVKGLKFNGFADFWWEDHLVDFREDGADKKSTVFITEPQLWYNVGQHFGVDNLSLGTEIELSNNFGSTGGFKCRPCLGVKWDF